MYIEYTILYIIVYNILPTSEVQLCKKSLRFVIERLKREEVKETTQLIFFDFFPTLTVS